MNLDSICTSIDLPELNGHKGYYVVRKWGNMHATYQEIQKWVKREFGSSQKLAGLPIAKKFTGCRLVRLPTGKARNALNHVRLRNDLPLQRRSSVSGCSHEHGNHPIS